MKNTNELFGVGASPGLALGSFRVIEMVEHEDYTQKQIESAEITNEIERIEEATSKAKKQISDIQDKALSTGGTEKAEVMEAHIMILQDPMFLEGFESAVKEKNMTAEGAVQSTVEANAALFESMDNAYMQERAHDIRDIGARIMNALLGIEHPDVSTLSEPTILIAHDIAPSMMASVDQENLLGIVTEVGGKTSHTAILASNMGIPAVMGCAGAVSIAKDIESNDLIYIDGTQGLLKSNLSRDFVEKAKYDIEAEKTIKASLDQFRNRETITKDGTVIQLVANVMGPTEVDAIKAVGAEGVGLFRSEFLFMDRNTLPTENEQFEAYKTVVSGMENKPVIIRTMDIGGDKEVSYLNLEKEMNPFLGYRALRICLSDTEMFQTQLRAILRASAYGKALIMFPMVSSLDEIRAAKEQVDIAKDQLRASGHDFDENIKVGIMIEIPSAAIIADILIKEVDFFSIGSNDLTQYTVAVDRMNQQIGALYNSYHPAMVRLVKAVVDAAQGEDNDKFAGMCGEMAGDPKAALLLVGLGLEEFSVSPAKLLRIRKMISGIDRKYAEKIANEALSLGTASEIEALLVKALPEELKMFL